MPSIAQISGWLIVPNPCSNPPFSNYDRMKRYLAQFNAQPSYLFFETTLKQLLEKNRLVLEILLKNFLETLILKVN